MPVHLRVFGAPDLSSEDIPGVRELLAQPRPLALLIYLTIARPHGLHQRDRLASLFWSEGSQEEVRGSLRKLLHRINRALGKDVLQTVGSELVGIVPGAISCDAIAFQELLRDGFLRRALDLFTDEDAGLLPSFYVDGPNFDAWLERERSFYREAATDAAWTLTERFATDLQLTNASHLARRVARLASSDERMLRKVLKMLAKLGDRAGAVHAYLDFKENLWRRLQTRPSRETELLIDEIRNSL